MNTEFMRWPVLSHRFADQNWCFNAGRNLFFNENKCLLPSQQQSTLANYIIVLFVARCKQVIAVKRIFFQKKFSSEKFSIKEKSENAILIKVLGSKLNFLQKNQTLFLIKIHDCCWFLLFLQQIVYSTTQIMTTSKFHQHAVNI